MSNSSGSGPNWDCEHCTDESMRYADNDGVLVVGASASIGLDLVRKFADRGQSVVATYNSKLPEYAIKYGDDNDEDDPNAEMVDVYSRWLQLDLSSIESIDNFANLGLSFENVIMLPSVLLGNSISEYSDDDIDNVMNVNFTGQFRLIQRLIPNLAENSQIILMSSISAQSGSYDSLYAASKAALLALVKSLSKQLSPKTRVNAIAPGLIKDSTMANDMTEETRSGHYKQTPTGKLLDSNDLARVIYDLTQPYWQQLNGACIDLNGGRYVR